MISCPEYEPVEVNGRIIYPRKMVVLGLQIDPLTGPRPLIKPRILYEFHFEEEREVEVPDNVDHPEWGRHKEIRICDIVETVEHYRVVDINPLKP